MYHDTFLKPVIVFVCESRQENKKWEQIDLGDGFFAVHRTMVEPLKQVR